MDDLGKTHYFRKRPPENNAVFFSVAGNFKFPGKNLAGMHRFGFRENLFPQFKSRIESQKIGKGGFNFPKAQAKQTQTNTCFWKEIPTTKSNSSQPLIPNNFYLVVSSHLKDIIYIVKLDLISPNF